MSEPKRLTAQQKLSKKELADAWDDVFYDDATRGHDCINAHIAALEAELEEVHAIIAELVGPESAGMDVSDVYEECIYCAAIGYPGADAVHGADCPIVRGRALLKGERP